MESEEEDIKEQNSPKSGKRKKETEKKLKKKKFKAQENEEEERWGGRGGWEIEDRERSELERSGWDRGLGRSRGGHKEKGG